ncbi:MAG: hypothetical protein OEZ48_13235 [Candidatus Bathyarchaeota archaeon]|nr:hypothetical protein [Candidatus Bathyarchaeota archaeon]
MEGRDITAMKDWKFVALWAFILISGEFILYGQYYLLFSEPDLPFRLVKVWHSSASGANWNDEEDGWHYVIQFVWYYDPSNRLIAIEDIHIDWERLMLAGDKPFYQHENRFIKQLVQGENFTVWTRSDHVEVTITYYPLYEEIPSAPIAAGVTNLKLRAVTN